MEQLDFPINSNSGGGRQTPALAPRSKVEESQFSYGESQAQRQSTLVHGSACDSCKRRRVRCDGSQPCQRCSRSAISCTFGSLTARSSAVGYARYLERKVSELERLLSEAKDGKGARSESVGALPIPSDGPSSDGDNVAAEPATQPKALALDLFAGVSEDYSHRSNQDDSVYFYGRFSGLNILRLMANRIQSSTQPSHNNNNLMGGQESIVSGSQILEAFEGCSSWRSHVSLSDEDDMLALLPSWERLRWLTDLAVGVGMVGHDCIDWNDLDRQQHALYHGADPTTRSVQESLALTFALLALGEQFAPVEGVDTTPGQEATLRGATYFHASLLLQNRPESHNLCSIRTVIIQTKFLLSASNMSQAYIRLQVGVAMVQMMGFYSSASVLQTILGPAESLQYEKVLATVDVMDTYLSALFGVAKTLGVGHRHFGNQLEVQIDAGTSPADHDPLHLQLAQVATDYHDQASFMAAILHHRQQTYTDPPETQIHRPSDVQMRGDWELVASLGHRLDNWQSKRFMELPSKPMTDTRGLFAQLSVRLLHAATQGMLYRPYLSHLVVGPTTAGFSIQGFEFGSRCLNAALQAVWVTDSLHEKKLLHPAHWTATYMLSQACLVILYVRTNASRGPLLSETFEEMSRAIDRAESLLSFLALHNSAARQCHSIIADLSDPSVTHNYYGAGDAAAVM